MPSHVVLLFEPDRGPNEAESPVAEELERAGCEVIETHSLGLTAALLFVSRRVEALMIDAASDQVFRELAWNLSALRPGLPLLRVDRKPAESFSVSQAQELPGHTASLSRTA